jgi:NAD(P)-dependent dehydrogenase (short-subunit alcohol dehydrogenase family)
VAERFAGRVLLATGAGSGLGAAVAVRFSAEGGRVAVLDLDSGRAEATAAGLEGAIGLGCDVAEEASVRAAVSTAYERLRRIDGVVNAAGFAKFGPLEQCTLDDWNRMLAVHLTGTFLVCREAVPLLRVTGGGSIVNFASVAALVARPQAAAYAAAKGGVVSFSRQLALDVGTDGIRVNVIAPGTVRTPMSDAFYGLPGEEIRPLPPSIQSRMAEPEEIAAAVCFLLADESSFFTGTTFVADGGATAI